MHITPYCLVLALLAGTSVAQRLPDRLRDLDYEAALAEYRNYLARPSLYKRTQGRLVLAHTGDPRALSVLAKSYGRPEAPADQVRYLIASITTDAFDEPEHLPALTQWREKHSKPQDAWLWFSILSSRAMRSEPEAVRKIAFGRDHYTLRAAALEVLARNSLGSDEELAQAILALLQKPPSNATERSVLLESCAAVLGRKRALVRGDTWRPVCELLIDALEDSRALTRTRVALSRQFAAMFDTENLGFEPRLWRFKLDQGDAPKRRSGGTQATFFGIRSLGERICYLVDASDSMMKRVTDHEKRQLAAITGPRSVKKKKLPIEDRLPWERIVTRFDVVREYLKLSLAELDKTKTYAVILFGDTAEPLLSTPKLMPATFANQKRTILELDAIEGGPAQANRPDGVLRGFTNMHGGLLAAFKMTGKGIVKTGEYVSSKTLQDGCDTVFVLSDGAPSIDNWQALDQRDPEDQAGDPETNQRFADMPQLKFYGPYVEAPHKHLVDEVKRLNLFRKVQIHCIGFGEADQGLLGRIARIGLGRVVKIKPPR